MGSNLSSSSAIAKLNNLIRESSVLRMATICQSNSFILAECLDERVVKDHWMGQVLVSGSQIRIAFRFYFNVPTLTKWSAEVFKGQSHEISLLQIHDLAKEYCNLVAGQLKYSLSQNQVKVGMSLPFLSRGSDKIFLPIKKDENVHQDIWRIKLGETYVTCSANIDIFKAFHFDLKHVSSDGGDIEFL